ncbi:MAG: hypothetical protein DCC75_02545, partial [Proteobacteria bacterium]
MSCQDRRRIERRISEGALSAEAQICLISVLGLRTHLRIKEVLKEIVGLQRIDPPPMVWQLVPEVMRETHRILAPPSAHKLIRKIAAVCQNGVSGEHLNYFFTNLVMPNPKIGPTLNGMLLWGCIVGLSAKDRNSGVSQGHPPVDRREYDQTVYEFAKLCCRALQATMAQSGPLRYDLDVISHLGDMARRTPWPEFKTRSVLLRSVLSTACAKSQLSICETLKLGATLPLDTITARSATGKVFERAISIYQESGWDLGPLVRAFSPSTIGTVGPLHETKVALYNKWLERRAKLETFEGIWKTVGDKIAGSYVTWSPFQLREFAALSEIGVELEANPEAQQKVLNLYKEKEKFGIETSAFERIALGLASGEVQAHQIETLCHEIRAHYAIRNFAYDSAEQRRKDSEEWMRNIYRNDSVPFGRQSSLPRDVEGTKKMWGEVLKTWRSSLDMHRGFDALTYLCRCIPGEEHPEIVRFGQDHAHRTFYLNASNISPFPGNGFVLTGLRPELIFPRDRKRPDDPYHHVRERWPWVEDQIEKIEKTWFLLMRGEIAVWAPGDPELNLDGIEMAYIDYNDHLGNFFFDVSQLAPSALLQRSISPCLVDYQSYNGHDAGKPDVLKAEIRPRQLRERAE